MGTQLPLPAGWARNFISLPDPRDRLDHLVQAELDARHEIRQVLDRLADAFDVPAKDVDIAMRSVDDTLQDLLHDIKRGYEHEIEDGES